MAAGKASAGAKAGAGRSGPAAKSGEGGGPRLGRRHARRLGMAGAETAPVGRHTDAAESRAESLAAHARTCGCGGTCPRCRAAAAAGVGAPSGGGLPPGVRASYERAFGTSLSGIRVATGPAAHAATTALGTAAFVYGNTIAFADGAYAPGTPAGDRRLGHELAHVVTGDSRTTIRRDPLPLDASAADAAIVRLQARQAEEAEPEAGETMERLIVKGNAVSVSENAAHTRRSLARAIGTHGWNDVSSAIGRREAAATSPNARLSSETRAVITQARTQYTSLREEYDRLSVAVRRTAQAKLEDNWVNLGSWRTFAAEQDPEHFRRAALPRSHGPFDMPTMLAQRDVSESSDFVAFTGMLERGEINSGCQHCHVAKEMDFRPDRLSHPGRMSAFSGFENSPMLQPTPADQAAMLEWLQAGPATATPTTGSTAPQPSAGPAVGGSDATVRVSPLTGQPIRSADYYAGGDLRAKLAPLESPYEVLPRGSLMRHRDGESLIAETLQKIDDRRTGYRDLKAKMDDGDYDFTKICGVLQEILPLYSVDMRHLLEKYYEAEAQAARNRGIVEAILSIGVLLLTIFPPTTALGVGLVAAAGLGLAASGFMQGAEMYDTGSDFFAGTGAGVFTREQEAAGAGMMAMGAITMFLSAVDLGTTAYAAPGQIARAGQRTSSALATTARVGSSAGEAIPWTRISTVFDEATQTATAVAARISADGRRAVARCVVDRRARTIVIEVLEEGELSTYRYAAGAWDRPPPAVAMAALPPGGGTGAVAGGMAPPPPSVASSGVPSGGGAIVPYTGGPPALPGPVVAPPTFPPVLAPVRAAETGARVGEQATGLTVYTGNLDAVPLAGGQGVWLPNQGGYSRYADGPIVTPYRGEPLRLTEHAGYVDSGWISPTKLSAVQAGQLPYPGAWRWVRRGDGNWYMMRPYEAAPASPYVDIFETGTGQRSTLLDIPGQHRAGFIQHTPTGAPRRSLPTQLSGVRVTDSRANSHVIAHAQSSPSVLGGRQSTSTFENFVAHDLRYNNWTRNTLEQQLSGMGVNYHVIEEVTGLVNNRGLPIVSQEAFVVLDASGQPAYYLVFDTTVGAWDAVPTGSLGHFTTPGGALHGAQQPLSNLPPRNVTE